jgi:hypothetical protein
MVLMALLPSNSAAAATLLADQSVAAAPLAVLSVAAEVWGLGRLWGWGCSRGAAGFWLWGSASQPVAVALGLGLGLLMGLWGCGWGLWQPAGSLLRTVLDGIKWEPGGTGRCWLVLTSRFWVLSLKAVSGREHSCFHGASCTSCIMAPSICTHNLTAAVLEGLQCSACCGRHTGLPAFICIGADAQALHKHDTMEVTVRC